MIIDEIVKRFKDEFRLDVFTFEGTYADTFETLLRKECEAVIEACAKEAEGFLGVESLLRDHIAKAIRGLKGE